MEIYKLAKEIAVGCGDILFSGFNNIKNIKEKSDAGDIVTDVDIRSEKYAMDKIKEFRPDDNILSEEYGTINKKSEYTWIIDPLDGTYNFSLGIPFFCVSIGVYKDNKPFIGVIYDPIHKELFSAKVGEGAFLNNEIISVKEPASMSGAVFYISWVKGVREKSEFTQMTKKISNETSYMRRFGSAALGFSYIASGRIHGFIESGLSPWDVAAGILIVNEAGGIVKDFNEKDIDILAKKNEIIASSKPLFDYIVSNLK